MKTGTEIRYRKSPNELTGKECIGKVLETFLENGWTKYLVDSPNGIEIVKPTEITLIELPLDK